MFDLEFLIVSQPTAETPSPFRSASERAADRERKREAVLLAAVKAFNQHGFHAASLDEVATSLGVSKPTIYHYLGNKDQVLLECVTRGLEQLRAAARRNAKGPGSGRDRLVAFLRHYAEIIMDDFGRCVIRTAEEALSPDSAAKFRTLKGEVDKAMRDLIEQGVADGSIVAPDVRLTAFTLAGALNWLARWHQPDGEISAGEIARDMVQILMRGVDPRP
ncbi:MULTISPECIES: TetR/AcrR family transcriptional regulator [Caulobacter]|uniref:Transcriptional regulator, TetR family n=1 Tax=Caulobacter vibrioides OR37 TaxID=1292034 RepID=R0E1P9_CAUVI|nr:MULTISPECIES: TetR/AcrR family transcriptional regulator [Caulobacter]ENZ79563.1 transcriptional regulator, TetR family [Caulobacter vibrioides OR37]